MSEVKPRFTVGDVVILEVDSKCKEVYLISSYYKNSGFYLITPIDNKEYKKLDFLTVQSKVELEGYIVPKEIAKVLYET